MAVGVHKHMLECGPDQIPRRIPSVPVHRGQRLRLPPHPDAPDPTNLRAIRRWVRSARHPTAIDLFCGAGGLSLGLTDAGFSVLVGADSDPYAVETHQANIGGLGFLGDLSDPAGFLEQLEIWGIRSVDLVAGGVPCQPFSRAGRSKIRDLVRAGRRQAVDPRTKLWQSFVRVVEVLRPRAVLLENVPDLAVWDDGAVLTGFRESLRQLGYSTSARPIDAFDFCVPQHRARLFVVGLRSGREFTWPQPRGRCTLRDAIGDLPPVPPATRSETMTYDGPRTELQGRLRRDVGVEAAGLVHDHITRDVRPDDAEAFALLGPGQGYADLPERLRRYRADIFKDKYHRLSWDDLCRSITAHISRDAYWYIHPDQDRTLSIREAARVQTFPDWFRFAGQPTHRLRQIGNAVPPLLAEAIGDSLLGPLGTMGRPRRVRADFREQLLEWHATHARLFPWRRGADAWNVLMAEVCLHRTRAEQVVPVYRVLTEIAPTPQAMVDQEAGVLEVMKSLGLRWRAERMVQMAREIVAVHDGRVPDHIDGLQMLPGVGDYVANAVLVFAFARCAVLIDTNTHRIVSRVRGLDRVTRWHLRSEMYDLAGMEGADAAFNYALIDLGALLCTPREPACPKCPVRDHCVFARKNVGQSRALRLPRVWHCRKR